MEVENLEWAVVFFGAVAVAHLYAIWSLINKSTKLLTAIQKDLRICLTPLSAFDDERGPQGLGVASLAEVSSHLHEIQEHTFFIKEKVRAAKF